MKKNLRERAEETTRQIQEILGVSPDDHPKEIMEAVEHAIIRALIEERDRCADMALVGHEHDQAKAHKVAEEIRQVKSVLINTLSSMR